MRIIIAIVLAVVLGSCHLETPSQVDVTPPEGHILGMYSKNKMIFEYKDGKYVDANGKEVSLDNLQMDTLKQSSKYSLKLNVRDNQNANELRLYAETNKDGQMVKTLIKKVKDIKNGDVTVSLTAKDFSSSCVEFISLFSLTIEVIDETENSFTLKNKIAQIPVTASQILKAISSQFGSFTEASSGKKVDFKDHNGKLFIIQFRMLICPPCNMHSKEIQHFMESHDLFDSQKFYSVAVVRNSNDADAVAGVKKMLKCQFDWISKGDDLQKVFMGAAGVANPDNFIYAVTPNNKVFKAPEENFEEWLEQMHNTYCK